MCNNNEIATLATFVCWNYNLRLLKLPPRWAKSNSALPRWTWIWAESQTFTFFVGIFPSAVWFVLSGQTRRSLFLGRLWVYQRSDCCSRTIWAPRMLDKIGNSIPEDPLCVFICCLNWLLLRIHSRICCICLIFSTVHFQMCPQIACPNICKDKSVAFFDFSTLCVFKCFLK